MILVIGATGKVGGQVVRQLRESGARFRALARDPASAHLPGGTEIVRGDLSDPPSLHTALEGVEDVFLVWPFLSSEGAPAVLEVIGGHARRVVYLSSTGVDETADQQADPINRFHADLERLIRNSGLRWTFVRGGGFASNDLQWAEQIRSGDVVHAPFAAGARAVVHEADLAAVAVHTLTTGGHDGKKYEVTGTEVLNTAERVRIIGKVLERPLRLEEVPAEAVRQEMLGAGWPADVVDGILDAHAESGTGGREEPVSPADRITGSPARTYHQWVADHAGDFR
ncbi:SDR family oxidoreductase [Allosalinactinospora lopnorensis]|uniref:SDR family oxidoreductase n=1 Tax=Allosalinactinospora lopnorensis TaxID=1352348 RepID=UPI000623D66A|nr:NAD(P)H-binding protein [Allosalinactinospora lopnorensis]